MEACGVVEASLDLDLDLDLDLETSECEKHVIDRPTDNGAVFLSTELPESDPAELLLDVSMGSHNS